MITPNQSELMSLSELNGEKCLEFFVRLRSDWRDRLENMQDDSEMRQAQGWCQALGYVIELIGSAPKYLDQRAQKEADASRHALRFG